MEHTGPGNFRGFSRVWLVLAMLGVIWVSAWGCSRPVARGYGVSNADDFFATIRPVSNDPARLLRNAHYFQLMGRPDLALKELEEAYSLDPRNLKVINALARTYETLGDYSRARQIYQEALVQHPDHQALANNLGFSYYQESKWPEAEACFKAALARNPKNDAARNNLGLLYCRLGKQDEAYRLWKDASGEAVARNMMQLAMTTLGKTSDFPRTASPPPAPRPTAQTAPPPLASSSQAAPPSPPEGKSPSPAPKPTEQVKQVSPEPKPPAPVLASKPKTVAASIRPEPAPATLSNRPEPAPAAPEAPPAKAAAGPPAPATKLTAQELGGTKILVLNGAGINKLAHRVRSMLHDEGYNVARIGNHIDFGAEWTIIYYRPEARKVAQALNARHFPMSSLQPRDKLPPGADVKIVLGKELAGLDQLAGLQPEPEDG